MQTVTIDVVCIVTFIVQTSNFFFSFLLGRWNGGMPSTSFCSLAIPLIISFSITVPSFFRCLIRWFCRCIPFTVTTIFCFFLLVSSRDDGIFLLFLGELFFRAKLNCLWLFVISTHLSVCCLIGFVLPFLEFPVTGSIESNVSSFQMISFILNCFPEFFYSVRCSILLVVFGHLERLFQLLGVNNIISPNYILHGCVLFSQLITADAWCFWHNMWYVWISIKVGILLCMVILCKW